VVGDFTSYLRERTMVKVLPILLELAAHTPELRAGITAPHRRALESVLAGGSRPETSTRALTCH
jgi:hypothetical protein